MYPDILNDVKRFSLIKPRIHDIDLDPKILAKTLGLTLIAAPSIEDLTVQFTMDQQRVGPDSDLHNQAKILPILRIIILERRDKSLYKQSTLSVPLWIEVPEDLGSTLKDLTGQELSLVQRMEKEIRRWYLKDLESISRDNETDFSVDQIYSSSKSFGRVTVFDIGSIDIVDEKTLAIAESFFDIIKSRITYLSSDIKSISNKRIK